MKLLWYDHFIFNSMCQAPCISFFFFFLQSDQICHIAYAVRSFDRSEHSQYWFNLCLMLWPQGHLSSCSLRNSFKSFKSTGVYTPAWIGLLLNGIWICWIETRVEKPTLKHHGQESQRVKKATKKNQQTYQKLKWQEVRAIPSEASTGRRQSRRKEEAGL